jgi:hypothetical protein
VVMAVSQGGAASTSTLFELRRLLRGSKVHRDEHVQKCAFWVSEVASGWRVASDSKRSGASVQSVVGVLSLIWLDGLDGWMDWRMK